MRGSFCADRFRAPPPTTPIRSYISNARSHPTQPAEQAAHSAPWRMWSSEPCASSSKLGRADAAPRRKRAVLNRAGLTAFPHPPRRCQIPACHVFRIPARQARGHLAKEWKDEVWSGRLRVTQRGMECVISLTDPITGAVFGKCPYSQVRRRRVFSVPQPRPLTCAPRSVPSLRSGCRRARH